MVPGSSNGPLAYRVARATGARLAGVEYRRFPDGERYVRVLDDVSGEDAVVLQSAAFSPDEYLVETFLLTDALKDLGARSVTVVMSYFPYARQDERFKPGEAVSLVTVSKLIRSAGADRLVTVDVHRHRVLDMEKVVGVPYVDATVMPLLARYAADSGLIDRKRAIVVGPDAEAEQWAALAAREIGADHASLVKTRLGDREVKVSVTRNVEVSGRDVLLVDDIISTGGTIREATRLLKGLGARRVIVGAAHALLVENALQKMLEEGVEEVFSSDTVPNQTTRVSAAPAIKDALRSLGLTGSA
ncbi:MAG: ribose-phosphate diphosphokinase [Conexivisphaera sp.]